MLRTCCAHLTLRSTQTRHARNCARWQRLRSDEQSSAASRTVCATASTRSTFRQVAWGWGSATRLAWVARRGWTAGTTQRAGERWPLKRGLYQCSKLTPRHLTRCHTPSQHLPHLNPHPSLSPPASLTLWYVRGRPKVMKVRQIFVPTSNNLCCVNKTVIKHTLF